VKDHLIACNLKPRLLRIWDRPGKLVDIMNRLALLTDHVMMQRGLRLVSAYLIDWVDLFYQPHGMEPLEDLVNSSKGDHGKPLPHLTERIDPSGLSIISWLLPPFQAIGLLAFSSHPKVFAGRPR
jgi:hypothetical protein